MTEVMLDKYQSVKVDEMIAWCMKNLPVKTWTVHFTTDRTAVFEFAKGRYATHFSSVWQ